MTDHLKIVTSDVQQAFALMGEDATGLRGPFTAKWYNPDTKQTWDFSWGPTVRLDGDAE